MSCYHPLKGFVVGFTKDMKAKLRVLPYEVNFIDKYGVPVTVGVSPGPEDTTEYYELPCGHCIGCRQAQSKEWANRLMMEMQYHDSAYFCTLTYDNDHIHIAYDEETGLATGLFTLCKRDVQLFIKLLRRHFPNDKIRYYLAGEYGDTTARPHYHAIIFGLHLNDLVKCGRSETGNQYFTSESFGACWPHGFVSVEPANYATCKYVSSYVTKKLGIRPNEFYEDQGIVPPFSLCSRKPGIGFQYYADHPDLFEYDKIVLSTPTGSISFEPPRYFKKKYKEADLDKYQERADRKMAAAEDRKELILDNTHLSYLDYLQVLENNHNERVKSRNKI